MVRSVVLVAIVLCAAVVRLRLAGVPLERDEGEYAYAGQLILQGVPPYQLAYNMKFPGCYYAYALIEALFGQTPWGIHVGLLLVNAATTLLLFFLARRVIGERGALVASAAFALLSLDRWIMGVWAHATHFVMLPVVAGLLLLLRALETKRLALLFAAGVCLGSSVLMKQHAAVFVLFALALVLANERRASLPRAGMLALGVAAPFALLFVVLVAGGVFGRFWLWAVVYARAYVAEVPWSGAPASLWSGLRTVTTATWGLWLCAVAGLVLLWLAPWRPGTRAFVSAFLLASFLATCPGFYFRAHYFIVMLPAVAMLVGVAVASLERLAERVLPRDVAAAAATAVFLLAAAAMLVHESDYLVSMSPGEVSRTRYGRNPFVEAPEIGRWIAQQTSATDRIAVIGSEPEIYFYARRRSATGYLYTYPLMEKQPLAPRMQDEMRREIETARPATIVFVTTPTSWLPRPDSDRRILTWANRFLESCYDVVGVAERRPDGTSDVRWGADAAGYQPASQDVVYTLRRKREGPCAAADLK